MLNRPRVIPKISMRLAEVEAEKIQIRYAGDAIRAIRQIGSVVAVEVEHREPEDLTESQRHDRQIVTRDPQCRRSDDQTEHRRGAGANEHDDEEGRLEADRRRRGIRHHRRDISTGAEEGDIPEVEQTGQADDDIEADSGRGKDDDLRRDRHIGIGAVLGEREEEGDDEGGQRKDLTIALGDVPEPGEEARPRQRRRGNRGHDQEADEDPRVLLPEDVCRAEEHERHQDHDDEDLQNRRGLGLGEVVQRALRQEMPAEPEGQRADQGHPPTGVDIDQAARFIRDRDQGVDDEDHRPGAESTQPQRRVEPVTETPQRALVHQGEHQPDDAEDDREELQGGGPERDGDIAEDGGVIAPREQAADNEQDRPEQGERPALGGVTLADGFGDIGQLDHARSTTFAPSRPWGRKTRTMMSSANAHTSFQEEPPN